MNLKPHTSFLIPFSLLLLIACNEDSGKTIQVINDSTKGTTVSNDSLQPPQDFHTTEFDVVENLFVSINARDWKVAGTFYVDAAVADRSLDYFRKQFETGGVSRFNLIKLSKEGEYLVANVRAESELSKTRPVEIRFRVTNNRVVSQSQG